MSDSFIQFNKTIEKLEKIFSLLEFDKNKSELFSELLIGAVQVSLSKTAKEYPGVADELKKITLEDIRSENFHPIIDAVEKILKPPSDGYFKSEFQKVIQEYLDQLSPTLPGEIKDKVFLVWQSL